MKLAKLEFSHMTTPNGTPSVVCYAYDKDGNKIYGQAFEYSDDEIKGVANILEFMMRSMRGEFKDQHDKTFTWFR